MYHSIQKTTDSQLTNRKWNPNSLHKKQDSNAASLKKLSSNSDPIQCRFTQDGTQYSFLSTYDLNGNPYLASEEKKETKNWQIKTEQTDVELEEVDDLYTPFSKENQKAIYHNLSMGREQRIESEGQKGILNPFKSYQFGVGKVPDVAVFNIGEFGAESGKLYPHYYEELKEIKNQFLKDYDKDNEEGYKNATKALVAIKSQMMPLIIAEDYRTRGALDLFDEKWNDLNVAFLDVYSLDTIHLLSGKSEESLPSKQIPKRGMVTEKEKEIKELDEAVKNATIKLPWAGSGGKELYRSSKDDMIWDESERPIDRREMSPEKDDTGGKWSKIDIDIEE
jgi:hypothetical protein